MRAFSRRALFYVLTAWAAITLNFLLPRLIPGDPVSRMLDRFRGQLGPEAVFALRALFGQTSNNIFAQYLQYWGRLLHGDLGVSFTSYPTPVATILGQGLPWTLGLIGVCTVLSFVIGTALGVVVGWRRGTWVDGFIPVTTFLTSIPYFWFALIVVYFFALQMHWFPLSGGYRPGLRPGWNGSFLTSVVEHAALPALAIVVSSIGYWLLGMRNMMVTTLAEDYVLLARAKGLSRGRIMTTYAARNALLPSLAGFALSLGFIVGGSIITEVVFNYPGIGYSLFQAVQGQDYPLMQGIFFVITMTVLAANLLADLAYVLLDPRTRVAV
ncbi:ABC transporter permease [Nakamurella endophytica]|uniref:Peptide ABC transporter permease n=1 Tax=Nakamurella endophytica TaxID=1748367 RepID=A0A917SV65_9ACTN|nr:ABC transporter permease [Nakamurella endophytica]GGL97598.1 peptide ABC transporter permease [Nakamurella endophytica]